MQRPVAVAALVCAALWAPARAGSVEFHGQASAWAGAWYDTSFLGRAGARYIPDLAFSFPCGTGRALDFELAASGSAAASDRAFRADSLGLGLEPYRLTARWSAPRLEVRAGLQKLNFGSALLLRPLQWFDRIDPRDPLALTDGVYGLLGRYYFQNNANLWAWGLVGNSSPKGWERFGSERWAPEFGGRAQVPVPRGEVAATYHHRTAAVVWYDGPTLPPDTTPSAENRVGLDGKWDLGIGLAGEAAVSRVNSEHVAYPWQRMVTVGLDYTFGIGAGFGAVVEHMYVGSATGPFAAGKSDQVSGLSLSYPLSIIDNLRGVAFYDWQGRHVYAYLGWVRTLDRWMFSLAGFWNPAQPAALPVAGGGAGRGIELTVTFNH